MRHQDCVGSVCPGLPICLTFFANSELSSFDIRSDCHLIEYAKRNDPTKNEAPLIMTSILLAQVMGFSPFAGMIAKK
jgi:hypothetical protein